MSENMTNLLKRGLCAALVLSALSLSAAQAQTKALPVKHKPEPTNAAITEADLMTRLYIFADDSMQGRQAGREGNRKGTDYIARDLKRLGVEPAGDNGTYFQNLPATLRKYTSKSALSVDGKALRWNTDFVAVPANNSRPRAFTSAQVVYGGVAGDTANQISAAAAAGKLVVLTPAAAGQGRGGRGGGGGRGQGGGAPSRFADAAAVATIDLQILRPSARALLNNPLSTLNVDNEGRATQPQVVEAAPALRITPEAAAQLFGRSVEGLTPGTTGGTVTAKLVFVEERADDLARNVVGIIRGADPALAGQYVAIGAHNDHVGFTGNPVNHDSLKAFNDAEMRLRMAGGDLATLTEDQRATIKVDMESHRKFRPMRLDSINNGADDDGSGSMAVLEIAEAVARAPQKPRRSVIFVWHTAEERGLVGASY